MMYFLPLGVFLLAAVQASVAHDVAHHLPHPSNRCPHGYTFTNDICYKVVADRKGYNAAQAHCESTGGTLASPNSQEDIDAIVELAGQHPGNPNSLMLSYTDRRYEGIFVDGQGKVLTHPTFFNGEPNDCCGGEDCLELRSNGRMNDIACRTELASVCSACPRDLSCHCPPLWHEHDGDCYRFFARPRSFQDAEVNCQSYHSDYGLPAHLASVHCDSENNFITDLIDAGWPGQGHKRTWLGFNDLHHEGSFEWTDHSDDDYNNWKPNEPNNVNGNEHCGETNFNAPGDWNDIPCHLKRASVCKMPVFNPLKDCHKLAEIINKLIGQCSTTTLPPI